MLEHEIADNGTIDDTTPATLCVVGTFGVLDIIDTICLLWFTVEYLLYLWASPDRLRFLRSPIGIIDLLTIVPFYIEVILRATGALKSLILRGMSRMLILFRMLRAFRAFRILKLARYSLGLRAIGKVLRGSIRELLLVVIFLFMMTVFFGIFIFYVEVGEQGTKFTNIPVSSWWSLVTLTTLGYGDIVPETAFGKIIGCVATVSGVILLAFPVSIIVDRFTVTYMEMVPNKAIAKKARSKKSIAQYGSSPVMARPPTIAVTPPT